eukprot:CAMPEP_0183712802 /NCGR_PEP_ID=MMETSP0737-20130205/7867_1 /TAXON_ID=385413 /ORGANISM="Thalassiosira miniscula, Strain CCMP1093" /LENGTH=136 /DNA_ID=CAMNT_0025941509 /DNA_START=331 /DNA_END=741 /DNA_ORIENTATION=+
MSTSKVTFSKYSQLVVIPPDSNEEAKWFSVQEKNQMKRAFFEDVMRVSSQFHLVSPPPDLLYECVGIEKFLAPGIARRVANEKRAHCHVIVAEKRRQMEQGVCDVEKLSTISKMTSMCAVKRAQSLASSYSQLLDA